MQIRIVLSSSISAKGDCTVALCQRWMVVHLLTAMALSIIGFVDCARNPTHLNAEPGSVQ